MHPSYRTISKLARPRKTNAERPSDEVIHVVSGFLAAGFPHVVGCLWPSNDRVCVEVARVFCSSLFGREESWWQDEQPTNSRQRL